MCDNMNVRGLKRVDLEEEECGENQVNAKKELERPYLYTLPLGLNAIVFWVEPKSCTSEGPKYTRLP